jgi:hypothetical protein
VTVHGLDQHGASLEAAYLELTRASTVYGHSNVPTAAVSNESGVRQ